MSKIICINNEYFELINPRNKVEPFTGWFCDENAIFFHYDKPSIHKINIWRSWLKWARDTEGVVAFEISSHNCMQFTISGLYVDDNGNEYNIYITKAHNKLIKVNS